MSEIIATITQPEITVTIPSVIRHWGIFSAASQTLAAGDTISANADIMRISGAGGAVTLTSKPTIQISGVTDGQALILWGQSDTNLVTIQDNSNLAGSLLHLHNARNYTFGLNDVYFLIYDASQGLWVPMAPPVDSY